MKVLVAGATGFIGRQVVREALALGHEVFALVRPEKNAFLEVDPDAGENLTTLPWGADPDVLRQGFEIPRGAWIVNVAGIYRERPHLNLDQTHGTIGQIVVELAEAVEASRIVHLSPLLKPETDGFIQSKALMEQCIQTSKVPWSILRSAPVYGPGDELLDSVGAWMSRSPAIPRFMEQVPLQPIWVGDLATALLQAREGVQEVGGERILWGELLEQCAEAAGKNLIGPVFSDSAILKLAQAFEHRSIFTDLLPFTAAGFLRHRLGYEVPQNRLPELLGHPPRSLADYLRSEWPYRYKKLKKKA